jgi:sulfite reductase alpha subunit-like flavoprotein
MQPRYYSISSSERFNPNELHVTVSVVTYTTPSGIRRNGICSTYLQRTVPLLSDAGKTLDSSSRDNASKVRLFISPNIHFRLPGQERLSTSLSQQITMDDEMFIPLNSPLLMFAVGSGIAPFRSFWQELKMLKRLNQAHDATRVLFMGCRSPVDFLFAQELQALSNHVNGGKNIFTKVVPVYSRENAGAKQYVQHAMLDHEELIYSVLTHKNGFIYMCGSTRACKGIESSLASILQSFSAATSYTTLNDANRILLEMKEKGAIKQDMFG